ncbi:hypothetical protein FOVG_17409 [Fusarium oxysporum f. sp. pisi HDV247]|uniref:Uncharacterized protein n=1 Tax=Fusarium oxysporum f. sp. pisi HDV247 TaxID=1080344 RepID=W9NU19_FUSOX|nr:hypothetical protein FOVG_17409 [Fusarium oxysporum f. sp. pisi HDV247]
MASDSKHMAEWPDPTYYIEGSRVPANTPEYHRLLPTSLTGSNVWFDEADKGPEEYNLGNLETLSEPAQANAPVLPKPGTRFSLKSIEVLQGWYSAYIDDPYPSKSDIWALQEHTDLSEITSVRRPRRWQGVEEGGTFYKRSCLYINSGSPAALLG